MYCSNCGNEIKNQENRCDNCGYNLIKPKKTMAQIGKTIFNKKIFIPIIAVVVVVVSLLTFLSGGIEGEAKKYIRETKKLEDVQEINGVVCVSKKYINDKENTYGYVVLYTTKFGSDYAYYENGTYKGNGQNGGEATKYEDKTFYNLHASSAMKKAIEYIQQENLTVLSCEKHIDVDEGVVYVKLDDFPNWLNNQ